MPLKEKSEPLFGLMFFDQVLFSRWFWKKDLSLPMSVPQKLMYADIAEKRLNCTGRKTAKTILLESRLIRESCIHQGDLQEPDEAMFFTPGQAHMTPVEDRIMSRLQAHPIFSLFKIGYNKNLGTLDLATGLRWYFRIEGTTGRETNMVGPRTIFMFGDELAFGNSACERGRKQTALPGCQWMYCGVPNGIRNSPFYELDQTSKGVMWSRHKLNSLDNPMYTHEYGTKKKAIKVLEKEYGDRNEQGFVTQVLGLWGEEAYSAFPPSMICRRLGMPFISVEMGGTEVDRLIQRDMLAERLRIPRVDASRYAIGLDYGYAQDPAVMMVAYEAYNQEKQRYEWLLLAKIRVWQVPAIHQARILDFLNRELFGKKVQGIATDEYEVLNALTNTDTPDSLGHKDDYESKCIQSSPQGVMEITDEHGEPVKDSFGKPVKKRRKQWMTEELRNAMSYANLDLPRDYYIVLAAEDVKTIEELVNTVERRTEHYVVYEPAKSGQDHNTDALRDLACAIHFIIGKKDTGGQPGDYRGYGWAGTQPSQPSAWKAPWG